MKQSEFRKRISCSFVLIDAASMFLAVSPPISLSMIVSKTLIFDPSFLIPETYSGLTCVYYG